MMNEDSDVTIGPGRLLGLFFMLVVICGVFFAIGYSLGKTSAREQALNDKAAVSASLGAPAVSESSVSKPSAIVQPRVSHKMLCGANQRLGIIRSRSNLLQRGQTDRPDAQGVATGGTDPSSAKTKQDKAAEPQSRKNTPPVETRYRKTLCTTHVRNAVRAQSHKRRRMRKLVAAPARRILRGADCCRLARGRRSRPGGRPAEKELQRVRSKQSCRA